MNQAGVSICANMRLHAKVPLVSLLGLVHLRVTLARAVLGRCGRSNQGRVNHPTGLEHQTTINQPGVDTRQHLNSQLMRFKKMAEPQDGGLIGQPGSTCIKLRELAKQSHVMQGLFHGRVAQSKPLLHEMNAQHGRYMERRSTGLTHRSMGMNQRTNSVLGTTRFISSKNSRLRVRLVTNSNPVLAKVVCFIYL